MKKFILLAAVFAVTAGYAQKSKLEEDRKAILSMEGCYKVTFEFAETFAPDTSYEYHDRKFDWGIEHVEVVENSKHKISLQHLLIVNDTMIIKHWRQDWVYQPNSILVYHQGRSWSRKELSASESKGQWAQKVYQVDDSPRYEGIGTWVHVDGRHFWEATADAPLPRREFTKRNDYNVMRRLSHMEITDYGFVLEQDNEKILRTETGDQLICAEKGMEKFIRGDYDCSAAIAWWSENQSYWELVRKEWNKVLNDNPEIEFVAKVDNQLLFMALFALGDEAAAGEMDEQSLKLTIRETIQKYIV